MIRVKREGPPRYRRWVAYCSHCIWYGHEPTPGEAGDLGRRHLRARHGVR